MRTSLATYTAIGLTLLLPSWTRAAGTPELVSVQPSGLTAARVGKQAAANSFRAHAADETLRAAAGKVDQAWVGFLPRLSATGRYTRLSTFDQAPLFPVPAGANPVFSAQPPGSSAPLDPALAAPVAASLRLPVIPNQYLLQVAVIVPISDMLLRNAQTYAAASHAKEAAEYDLQAARARAQAEGKIAYYTWLRALGASTVADLALRDQQARLNDTKNMQTAGNAAQAERMRAENAVRSAELVVARAHDLVVVCEKRVRQALHVEADDKLVPGEGIEPDAELTTSVERLTGNSLQRRPELKSLEASAKALRSQARADRFSALPQLSAFGDVTHANPNPRTIPPQERWLPTWAAGAQVTWSPNDALTGAFAGKTAAAKASAVEAELAEAKQAIELEIVQRVQEIQQQQQLLDLSKRELRAAEESQRAARDLFTHGRLPPTAMNDADAEVTRARLSLLNTSVDTKIARVRLQLATGEPDPRP